MILVLCSKSIEKLALANVIDLKSLAQSLSMSVY